jgi:hypothetical protein
MTSSRIVRAATTGVSILLALALSGCAVVTIAGAAAGLAVDATVGAVQLTGKAIGAAANAVSPGESK